MSAATGGGDPVEQAMEDAANPAPPPRPYRPPVPRVARPHGIGAPDVASAVPQSAPAQDPSWSGVASSAASNFIPSFVGQVKGIVSPLLPQNWASDVQTANQLGVGAESKLGLIDKGNPTEQAKDEGLVNALGSYYAKKYGTTSGFKQALATDPASFLTDIASVASIAAGGEGLAAKLPGALGDAAAATARGAGVVERATNPLSITARVAGAVLPKASAGSGRIASLTARAFPALDAADVASDPATVASVRNVIGQKGATVPAAREGLLRRFDNPAGAPTPIPTSLTTGQAPPVGAANAVADATSQWRQNLGDAATAISGAPEPSPSDLGTALEQAQIARHNAYVDNYNVVAAQPGKFDPAFATGLPAAIDKSLTDAHLPPAASLAKYPQYATTVEATNWLTGHVNDLAANGELTPQSLMEARKGLSYYWNQAKGPDEKGIGSLIGGLDDHIQNSAASGLFSGNSAAVADNMQKAIAGFRDYKGDFANTSNPTHSTVASAMKSFIPDQVRDPSSGMITGPAPEGAATAAQGALGAKLINPRTLASPPGAMRLHGELTDVLGGPTSGGAQALNDYVRQSVTKTAPDGSLLAKPDQIHGFLNGPLANAFAPHEQSQLRQLAEAQRMVTSRPTQAAKTESTVKSVAGRALRVGAAAGVGHLIGGPFGHVVGGGLADFVGEHGGILGGLAESAAEPILGKRGAAKALKGAPASGNLLLVPGRIARNVANRRGTALSGAFYGASPAPVGAVAESNGRGDQADAAALIERAEGKGKNPLSSAAGPFQMIDGTWGAEFRKAFPDQTRGMSDTQLAHAYRDTPEGQAVTEQLGRNHVAGELAFLKTHQIPVNPRNAYIAHVFGTGDAGRLFGADPNASLASTLPDADKVLRANPVLRGKTVGDTMMWAQGTMDRAAESLNRQPRASGGKVGDDIERLVTRLQTLAKHAKNATKKATEPLLNVPDAAITKALDIAQRAI
jgi:hypothetical protein